MAEQVAGPINPELYNKLISLIKPIDVRVVRSQFETLGYFDGVATVRATASEPLKAPQADPFQSLDFLFQILQDIVFEVVSKDNVVVGKGTFSVRVRVQLREQEIPDNFWSVFLKRNVLLYVNPAVRDLINALCWRSGISATLMPSMAVVPNLPIPQPTPVVAAAPATTSPEPAHG